MNAPVKVQRAVKSLLKLSNTEITNEQIILAGGGTDEEWGAHLKGARVSAIVAACNVVLVDDNRALASEGVGSERWRIVTVAEAHQRKARFNLERIDGSYRRAHDHVLEISRDSRAEKKLRRDALAWVTLFEEEQSSEALGIMREFADEILKLMPAAARE